MEVIAALARVPRATMAGFVGGGLGASGALLQSLYRNPLAGPGITGVSPGATTAVVVFLVYGPELATSTAAIVTPVVAIAGGALTAGFTYAISSLAGRADPLRLILTGILFGGVLSTVTSFVLLTQGRSAVAIIQFLAGSIDVVGWEEVRVVAIASIVVTPLIVYCIPLGNVLALGDNIAHGVGERVGRARLMMLFTASTITAVAVAFVGGMVFVGLIAPHIARRYVGGDLRRLVPAAALTGTALVLLGDLLARSVRPADWNLPFPVGPTTLPAGVYLTVAGALFFARIVRKTT